MDASGGQAIGSTLSSGVQDISSLLPLLGTEQCEDHVASGLTKGYLYVAASPLSLFGSLGVARAGFKTFMAAISVPSLKFEGAQLLADVGFRPQGTNMSLIMVDIDQEQKSYGAEKHKDSAMEGRRCYRAESRLASMMEELHIEDSNRVTVSSMSPRWNIMMILSTALSCTISIAPYVHLNLHEPNALNHFVRWAFPVMRAIGGFLTATMIQLVIQLRLLAIVRRWIILQGREKELQKSEINVRDGKLSRTYSSLDRRYSLLEERVSVKQRQNHPPTSPTPNSTDQRRLPLVSFVRQMFTRKSSPNDVENSGKSNAQATSKHSELGPGGSDTQSQEEPELGDLQRRIAEANGNPFLMFILLALLLVGVIASIAGYIGCFSAVQGSASSREALIWLGLEVGLSIVRVLLWGLNPERDDAPPLKFDYKLDEHPPFPTCTLTAEAIEEGKDLPLVRASEFLEAITSYAGLLKRFDDSALSLYYTLTWRRPTSPDKPGERVLYITIYDHAERTARVCTNSRSLLDNSEAVGSAVAGVPQNIPHSDSLLFCSADPITVDLEHGVLKTRLGHQVDDDPIATTPTLRSALLDHYRSILDQVNFRPYSDSRADIFEDDWSLTFSETESKMQRDSKANNRNDPFAWKRDHDYLAHGQLEGKLRDLFRVRGRWIEDYMAWLGRDMDERLGIMKEVHHMEIVDRPREVEELLMMEQLEMERILLDEVYRWEEKLRLHLKDVTSGTETGVGVNFEGRWKGNLWERLGEGWQAMLARMRFASRGSKLNQEIDQDWLKSRGIDYMSLFEQLTSASLTPLHPFPTASRLDPLNGKFASMERCIPVSRSSERKDWFSARCSGMKRRLLSEAKDAEERLKLGLKDCHNFSSDRFLPGLTHSESKWQNILFVDNSVISALGRNRYVTHITVDNRLAGSFSADSIIRLCDVTQCTSSFFLDLAVVSTIQLPQNLLSVSGPDLDLFESPAQSQRLELNRSQAEKTQRTTFEFVNMVALWGASWLYSDGPGGAFIIRFFGPTTSSLRLRLIHRARETGTIMRVQMNDSTPFNVSVSESTSLRELILVPKSRPASNSELLFKPNFPNTLTCSVFNYELFDIELVGKDGRPYGQVAR